MSDAGAANHIKKQREQNVHVKNVTDRFIFSVPHTYIYVFSTYFSQRGPYVMK